MMSPCHSPYLLHRAPLLVGLAGVCSLVLAAAADAQGREGPPVADVTRRLLDDAPDGRLDAFDLPTAALVASGVEDECELAGWLSDYYEKRAEALEHARSTLPDARLLAIHRAMHERLLIGRYRSTASDLRLLLGQGDYNCLSAAVVFADLCREAGIELEFCLQPGHLYVRTPAGGGQHAGQRIEPASPRWQPSLGQHGGLERGPSSVELDGVARRLSTGELLAKLYYNRGLVRLAEHDYPAGLALLRISQVLDPADRDARQNLVAGLNNWAARCCRQRQYQEAARLIQQGLLVEPGYLPLRANERLIERLLGEPAAAD